jgi:hypothetical protein
MFSLSGDDSIDGGGTVVFYVILASLIILVIYLFSGRSNPDIHQYVKYNNNKQFSLITEMIDHPDTLYYTYINGIPINKIDSVKTEEWNTAKIVREKFEKWR